MEQFASVEDILDFAIDSEQKAVDLYTDLAQKAKNPGIKAAFEEYANEERGHKAKLTEVKEGKRALVLPQKAVQDLKIGDYLVSPEPDQDTDYQDVLIFAMKKEKAAFKLYTDLAELCEPGDIRDLLLSLAQEEAKHKLRFEIEYDDNIYQEN